MWALCSFPGSEISHESRQMIGVSSRRIDVCSCGQCIAIEVSVCGRSSVINHKRQLCWWRTIGLLCIALMDSLCPGVKEVFALPQEQHTVLRQRRPPTSWGKKTLDVCGSEISAARGEIRVIPVSL